MAHGAVLHRSPRSETGLNVCEVGGVYLGSTLILLPKVMRTFLKRKGTMMSPGGRLHYCLNVFMGL